LVLDDTLVAHPDIRWILGHAGGVVPFMAERLGKAHYAKMGGLRWGRILKDLFLKRHGGLALAKGVGYDTVGADNPVTVGALRRLVGPDRIHFGSDLPWGPEESVEASIRFLELGMKPAPSNAGLLGGKGSGPC
jgi:predicted TIM-barrel fold metal-dependent hydrolase